jgi:hypothetical protein
MYYSMPINMFLVVKNHWQPYFTDNPRIYKYNCKLKRKGNSEGLTGLKIYIQKVNKRVLVWNYIHLEKHIKGKGNRLWEII